MSYKVPRLFRPFTRSQFKSFHLLFDTSASPALAEAQEIDLYLRTLIKHFQALEDTDFTECQPLFRPLFHVICMVWRDSKYYCSSSKLMVLLKQICNLLIYQVLFDLGHICAISIYACRSILFLLTVPYLLISGQKMPWSKYAISQWHWWSDAKNTSHDKHIEEVSDYFRILQRKPC